MKAIIAAAAGILVLIGNAVFIRKLRKENKALKAVVAVSSRDATEAQ